MARDLTSVDGAPITVRPIDIHDIDNIVLRCWPERDALLKLFAEQGTIGMAAWEDGRSVAVLHCFRVWLPEWRCEHWPAWNRWWPDRGWWSRAAREAGVDLTGPAWCHGCIHVGRTLASDREETLAFVLRFAPKNDWDVGKTLAQVNSFDGVDFRRSEVEDVIDELRSSGRTVFETTEPQYHGRGIGTALCRASVQWAREHGYVAMVAAGAPDGLFAFATWSGHLPWTSYAKLGFHAVGFGQAGWSVDEGEDLPGWARGASPPDVVAEVEAALASGRPPEEIRERLMVLHLTAGCDE